MIKYAVEALASELREMGNKYLERCLSFDFPVEFGDFTV
jgi:hypothetical protein